MSSNSKPIAKVSGEDGNVFNLIAIVRRVLIKDGKRGEADKMVAEINREAKSYHHALGIMSKYVDLR